MLFRSPCVITTGISPGLRRCTLRYLSRGDHVYHISDLSARSCILLSRPPASDRIPPAFINVSGFTFSDIRIRSTYVLDSAIKYSRYWP